MSEQEPQSEIIPASLADNAVIETIHPDPVPEVPIADAYVASCRLVKSLAAELKEAQAENSRLALEINKRNRPATLAECNAAAKKFSQSIDKDRMAAANYAASRGLVLTQQPVSSPSPRIPKPEGK